LTRPDEIFLTCRQEFFFAFLGEFLQTQTKDGGLTLLDLTQAIKN